MLASWLSLLEQLQNENQSEEMLLVEAEFLSSPGFRTVSGNRSKMHTLSKVRQAAGLWAVACVDVCVHVCAFMCAQSGHAFPRDRNNKAACLYLDNGTHSRMGSIIQNKDHLLSMFKRSCCIFRKRSSLLSNFPCLFPARCRGAASLLWLRAGTNGGKQGCVPHRSSKGCSLNWPSLPLLPTGHLSRAESHVWGNYKSGGSDKVCIEQHVSQRQDQVREN